MQSIICIHIETRRDDSPHHSPCKQSYGKTHNWFRVHIIREHRPGLIITRFYDLAYTRDMARVIKQIVVNNPLAFCATRDNWTNNPL